MKVEGVILVAHDKDGDVTIADTGDHVGRKGMGWGGGVRTAGGAVRAPAARLGRGGRRRGRAWWASSPSTSSSPASTTRSGRRCRPARRASSRPSTTDQRLAVERALPGSLSKSVVQTDKKGLHQGAEGVPRRGDGQIQAGPHGAADRRSELRRRHRADASISQWRTGRINMTPTPPEGAPNVLLVLIDDAGFGNPSTFGGPVDTPNMTRVAEKGLPYNRFHVTAMCSPTRAATLTGRNNHSVGFGSLGRVPGAVPRLHRRPCPGAARRSRGSSGTTATAPPASASGT